MRVLVPAKAGDDAVALALVLHLEHHALVRLIDTRLRLGHHAVQSCPLEAAEPVSRRVSIARRRREVERCCRAREHGLERGASRREGRRAQVTIALTEHVEEHDRCRRLASEGLHARGRRMQPELQRLEVERVV